MFRQKIQGGFFTMDMSSFSLEGKIALITGASYGIGMAIAKGMACLLYTSIIFYLSHFFWYLFKGIIPLLSYYKQLRNACKCFYK